MRGSGSRAGDLPRYGISHSELLKQRLVRLLRVRCEAAHRTHITYEAC